MKNLKAGSVRQLHTACLVCTKHCVLSSASRGNPTCQMSFLWFSLLEGAGWISKTWPSRCPILTQAGQNDQHRPIESLETL